MCETTTANCLHSHYMLRVVICRWMLRSQLPTVLETFAKTFSKPVCQYKHVFYKDKPDDLETQEKALEAFP